MNLKSLLGWAIGLLVLVLVLLQQDYATLASSLRQAGPALLLVLLFEPLLWLSQASAWQLLFAPARRARFLHTLYASAIASAINNLLPVFAIGGDLLKARHLVKRGVAGADATAVGMVDLSLHAVSALGWSLVGMIMLSLITSDAGLYWASVAGILLLGAVITVFIAAQWLASAWLANWLQQRFSGRGWNLLAADTSAAQSQLIKTWQRHPAVLLSIALRLAGRMLMVPEIMFVAWLLGGHLDIAAAAMITGLVILVKTVSFAIPARVGVQEGSFLAAGSLLGTPVELMFGIAIAIRLRETLANLPVLLVWYLQEWRRSSGVASP